MTAPVRLFPRSPIHYRTKAGMLGLPPACKIEAVGMRTQLIA